MNYFNFPHKLQFKIATAIVLFFIAASGTYGYLNQRNALPTTTITVKRALIIQEITVTGKTKPIDEVELAFEKSGKISRVNTAVGDQVLVGQALVQIESAELLADLAQAKAALEGEQAKLQELQKGSELEDIKILQTELKITEQNLQNAHSNIYTIVADALIKADNAVRKELDNLFSNDEDTNPELTFATKSSQVTINAQSQRLLTSAELNAWNKELKKSNISLGQAKQHLLQIIYFLHTASEAILEAINVDPTALNEYKSSLMMALHDVNEALANINNQEQTIVSEKLLVEKAQAELTAALAGSSAQTIAAQAARVKESLAKIQSIQAQLQKNVLRAPLAGIITKQEAKIGEIISANVPLVAIISPDRLEIEVNVPEVDIGNITINNPVRIAFDALPQKIFSGIVKFIEPAETIIDGVVNFKVKITIINYSPLVKSGLTANLAIQTAIKPSALVVPQVAILEKDTGIFVKKITVKGIEELPVKIGIRDQQGNVEIISGLTEGNLLLNVGLKSK